MSSEGFGFRVHPSKDDEMTTNTEGKLQFNNSENKENDEMNKNIMEDFVDRSTLHGLQNVYHSRSQIHRFIWVLLMLTATVYVLFIVSNLS